MDDTLLGAGIKLETPELVVHRGPVSQEPPSIDGE
jgi:hypothetical protein